MISKKSKKAEKKFEGQDQGRNEKIDLFIIFSPDWGHMELI